MSFAITPMGQETPTPQDEPKIFSESYRHSIVDSHFQPERSLLTRAPGSPRMGEYYRVRKNRDEESTNFSPDNLATYQSYTRIKRTIINQEGDGSFSFDPESAESSRDITGNVISGMTPLKNDVIIFDIGDGLAGLFTVHEPPEPYNITANKLWRITYKFLCILTKELFENLESRVVEEKVYDTDAALHSGQSVVAPEDFDISHKLFQWKNTIGLYIMNTWYWAPEKTIAFKTELNQYVYDPYLVNFIKAVMTPEMQGTYPYINEFSLQYGGMENNFHGTINVWQVLLRGDFNLLKICDNKAAMVETVRLTNTRLYGNLRSSKFTWFICTDPENYLSYKAYFNSDGYPILRPAVEDNFSGYVFSEAFFTGKSDDPFEHMVLSGLRDRVMDKKKLLAYCEGYFDLDKKKQLYHGAILLMLLELSRKLGNPL